MMITCKNEVSGGNEIPSCTIIFYRLGRLASLTLFCYSLKKEGKIKENRGYHIYMDNKHFDETNFIE
tara:strand:+ start:610 stop:810 length:201 start_codon:yes stop_codon:yes gene_type:complete